jgi:hypothetical protein
VVPIASSPRLLMKALISAGASVADVPPKPGLYARAAERASECTYSRARPREICAMHMQGGIADVLMARDDWPGHFSVIEPGRIRVRVLPPESFESAWITGEVIRAAGGLVVAT